MAEILSPEEQSTALQESFDLVGALKAGHSKEAIASYLAEKNKFNIQGAKEEGYTDEQIIAHLLKGGASKAFGQEFIRQLGSSAQGIGQITGIADNAQIRAEKEASDIYGSLYPKTSIAGTILGAGGDPIALPAVVVAPLKAATITGTLARQGAAQGALGGVLEPITKEGADTGLFNVDRALNAIIGTAGGAVIGGGAGALIQRLTRKPDVPEVAPKTAADEISDVLTGASVKATDEAAPITRAADEAVPVERAITGEGIAPRIISDAETKAIETRIGQLSSEIDDLRWRQAEGAPKAEEPPVAALLKGEAPVVQREATDLPPVGRDTRGLVSPTRQEQQPQVASLFQRAQPEPVPPVVPRSPQQPALLKTNIEKTIQQKQEEITKLQERLAEKLRLEEARTKPELVQVETKKAVPAKEADIAPLTPAEQAKVAQLQQVLDKNGFKTVDEAVAATAKTAEERAAAQARIDAGQTQTLEQLVRGFRSGGSAAVPPERLYAESYPFSSAPIAAIRATTETPVKGAGVFAKTKIEPVSHAETNDVLKQAVNFLDSKELKEMREGGKFSGTLKGTIDAGIAAARKAAQEEGSYLGWLFKEDDKGNFINIDKSWDRGEIAAFMPIVRDASNIYKRLMDEAVNINMNGKLSDAALQDVMERMAYPIQIMGIFQAKRTQASRSLNAFKTLNSELKEGKNVKGFMNAGKTC
jgi:hypothetical protein